MIISSTRNAVAALALAAVAGTSMPALAQSGDEQARIRKLEAEVRALQRRVFPGSDGKYFESEITRTTPTSSGVATPSTTAVTDILVRLDAMESQIQSLTAQTEENSNSLRAMATRLAALETGSSTVATVPATATTTTPTAASVNATPTPTIATTPAASVQASPTAERVAAVSQIAKPQTDDPGDDEYSYGYRLWNAGFYPEAQQQLALFVERYPNHSRATYGRNLLGRAYLDDGKAREAAPWFLKNYQADKNARRAPDSLLYLAEAMIALNDSNRACIALAEFGETYPAVASGRLSDQYQSNIQKVDCD